MQKHFTYLNLLARLLYNEHLQVTTTHVLLFYTVYAMTAKQKIRHGAVHKPSVLCVFYF